MRNHDTEQLQKGNRKINSEKVSGQLSSIQLVHPLYYTHPWQGGDGAPELVSPQAAGPGHQQPRQAGLPQVPGLRGVGGVGAMNCAVSVPRVSSQQLYCTVDSE